MEIKLYIAPNNTSAQCQSCSGYFKKNEKGFKLIMKSYNSPKFHKKCLRPKLLKMIEDADIIIPEFTDEQKYPQL